MIETRHETNRDSALLLRETMTAYYARLHAAADDPARRVAWCSSVGPVELLLAMGFEVYFPENHAAMIGATKQAAKHIPRTTALGYSPEICSYLTSDIGAFLAGETPLERYGLDAPPRPAVLVYNTNQCHEVKEWFAFYAAHFNVPIIGIHTPLNVDEVSKELVDYIALQYRNLVPTLEACSGRRFDIDRFRETVSSSYDACVLWREVLETARQRPSPISFFDATVQMGPIVVMRGTSQAVEYYRVLKAELESRIARKSGAVPKERHRLYWEGMPLWFKLRGMATLFASLDTCVVASTYCNSWVFDDLDEAQPFESSALAYTRLFITRSEAVKERLIADKLEEFSVDGVMYHDAKTCARNSNTRFALPHRVHANTGLPYLEISGDFNDARCFSEEQTIIAIETFITQLSMRR